jgi:hypothetical protein
MSEVELTTCKQMSIAGTRSSWASVTHLSAEAAEQVLPDTCARHFE